MGRCLIVMRPFQRFLRPSRGWPLPPEPVRGGQGVPLRVAEREVGEDPQRDVLPVPVSGQRHLVAVADPIGRHEVVVVVGSAP